MDDKKFQESKDRLEESVRIAKENMAKANMARPQKRVIQEPLYPTYTAPRGTAKKANTKANTQKMSPWKRRMIYLLIAAGVSSPFIKEGIEIQKAHKIEADAKINANRDFNNIKQEKMGKYLKNEIQKLNEKYPNLEDNMYFSKEMENNQEFAADIYRLYKALMVDKEEEKIKDINDVEVVTEDQYILQADLIKDKEKTIARTHVEKYKRITDSYVEVQEGTKKSTQLAREVYELLVDEFGLKENVLSSKEIENKIEKEGIYYDESTNTAYTKEGKGHIKFDKEKSIEVIDKDER